MFASHIISNVLIPGLNICSGQKAIFIMGAKTENKCPLAAKQAC